MDEENSEDQGRQSGYLQVDGLDIPWLAAERPELVKRLVLAVTTAWSGSIVHSTIDRWQTLARDGRYRDLLVDTMESTFSAEHIKTYHWVLPLLGRVAKPRDPSSFLVQSEACAAHDAEQLSALIPGSRLVVVQG